MQRSLKQFVHSAVFLGVATLATGIAAPSALANIYGPYEPSFIRQADRALLRGDPAGALKILQGASELNLKSRHRAAALGLECRAQLKRSEPAKAREACLAAIETQRNRGNWRHYNNLGVAELHLGNYEAAERAFARASSLSGWASTPRRNLSMVSKIRAARDSANGELLAAELR